MSPWIRISNGNQLQKVNWFHILRMFQHPDAIESEYGMEGVSFECVFVRLAGYLMRRWNVDFFEDHSLKG